MSEHRFQASLREYLDLAIPRGGPVVWTSIDAGGKSSAMEAGQKIARGVRSGWPDTLFFYEGRAYVIELKWGDNTLDKRQQRVREEILTSKVPFAVAYSIEEVEAILREWGIPLRASVGASAAPSPAHGPLKPAPHTAKGSGRRRAPAPKASPLARAAAG